MKFSLIVVMTSCAPHFARNTPGTKPTAPPAVSAPSVHSGTANNAVVPAGSASPTNASNLLRFVDPALDAKIAALGEQALGPKQEAEYAELDREFMEQAPMAPYGTSTVATFVSSAIDLEKIVLNPTFGQDLTSFQFK